jgi:hypothetical protein
MKEATAPGSKWVFVPALAGFAAGFIGPMVFVPEANQGPMVGIFISGPAGAVAGLLFWAICSLIKLPARAQWRMLYATTALGVLTTLFFVQPGPVLLGYVYDAEVRSCASPIALEKSLVEHWNQRIAEVTWAEPRAGWQADMHRLLSDAPGVVVSARMSRKNAIRENRKPWNRGSQFASSSMAVSEETLFYDANGNCDQYPEGRAFRGFQKHDYEQRILAARVWPPAVLLDVLRASMMYPVPQRWAGS